MLTPKPFLHITLAAWLAFNALWACAERRLIGQGELPGDNKDQSKLSGLLEDDVTPHDRAGGLSPGTAFGGRGVFQRIATFPVFLNTDEGTQTAAEIVSASEDGKFLIYTDSPTGNLGFVDIADPRDPKPSGVLEMSGEPTSVAVVGAYALAAVNTSQSFG
ncbi:MAG: hypothetical protein L0Z68_07765 [Gammaproteobacteria bacterium]|nr:hypothetical protein [Gammaproteobacteria bacterium]